MSLQQKNDKKNILQAQIPHHNGHDGHDIEEFSRRFRDLSIGLNSIKVDPPIQVLLSWDLEWSMQKDENEENSIIAAGFCDTFGNKRALLLEDYLDSSNTKEQAEKKLLLELQKLYQNTIGQLASIQQELDCIILQDIKLP